MMSEWDNKQHDLAMVEAIIDKHLMLTDDEPLSLFNVVIKDDDNICCQPADWLIEAAECFCEKYGIEQAWFITKKIMAHCMIGNASIH